MINTRRAVSLAGLLGALCACEPASYETDEDAETNHVDVLAQGVQLNDGSELDCRLYGVVGHTRRAGPRVLSAGRAAWAMFDTESGAELIRGVIAARAFPERPPPLGIVGNLALVPGATRETLALRAAQTGNEIVILTPGGSIGSAGIATDGSYVWAATTTGLTAWSPSGTELLTIRGAYQNANVFAAPGQLRVAHGSTEPARRLNETAIVYRVELIDLTDGASTLFAPYVGQFRRWFDDGRHFVTDELPGWDYHHFYTHDSRPVTSGLSASKPAGNVVVEGGFGDYFWARVAPEGAAARLGVFQLGAPGAEAGFPKQILSLRTQEDTWVASERGSIAMANTRDATVYIARLTDPSRGFVEIPLPDVPVRGTFAADDAGGWVLGFSEARLVGGTLSSNRRQPLGCRPVLPCEDVPPWRPNSCGAR